MKCSSSKDAFGRFAWVVVVFSFFFFCCGSSDGGTSFLFEVIRPF